MAEIIFSDEEKSALQVFDPQLIMAFLTTVNENQHRDDIEFNRESVQKTHDTYFINNRKLSDTVLDTVFIAIKESSFSANHIFTCEDSLPIAMGFTADAVDSMLLTPPDMSQNPSGSLAGGLNEAELAFINDNTAHVRDMPADDPAQQHINDPTPPPANRPQG